jgi:hypothetical protein
MAVTIVVNILKSIPFQYVTLFSANNGAPSARPEMLNVSLLRVADNCVIWSPLWEAAAI